MSCNPYTHAQVKEIEEVMNQNLGFLHRLNDADAVARTYLYVADSRIVGCVIAQQISSAFKVINTVGGGEGDGGGGGGSGGSGGSGSSGSDGAIESPTTDANDAVQPPPPPASSSFSIAPHPETSMAPTRVGDDRVYYCSREPTPACVGINRMWVLPEYRRKGVATRLLDSVRSSLIYGTIIEKDRVAFTDPTPDGRRLAAKYTDRDDFLVYNL